MTRHGAGAFPTECDKEEINSDIKDLTNVLNQHQDTLRYGKLNIEELHKRCQADIKISGIPCRKTLAMTHMNEYCESNISLYEIYSGKTRSVKMWTSQYNKNPFEKNSILYIHTIEKKSKREPNGEINPVTGKKIYVPVPDKFEYWLSKYVIKNNIEEGEYNIRQI